MSGALLPPVALGLRLAAQRHASALAALTPLGQLDADGSARANARVHLPPYPGLEHLVQ